MSERNKREKPLIINFVLCRMSAAFWGACLHINFLPLESRATWNTRHWRGRRAAEHGNAKTKQKKSDERMERNQEQVLRRSFISLVVSFIFNFSLFLFASHFSFVVLSLLLISIIICKHTAGCVHYMHADVHVGTKWERQRKREREKDKDKVTSQRRMEAKWNWKRYTFSSLYLTLILCPLV